MLNIQRSALYIFGEYPNRRPNIRAPMSFLHFVGLARPPEIAASKPHTFNHDLLANLADIENAREHEQFGGIFHVLYHEELLNLFQAYDRKANHARSWVRRLGLIAVAGAALTMLGAATETIWAETRAVKAVSISLECAAILSAFVAFGGFGYGKMKKDWLESRLVTERLRQWHFQLLVCRMTEIAASCDPNNPQAVQEFKTKRERWFNQLNTIIWVEV